MGLFNSLYTSSAGMYAQTRSTTLISENIANLTTTGYKRSNSAFQDLVLNNKGNINGSGSVIGTRVNRIDQQGSIQQTSSGTDVALSGNGFFVVRNDPTDPLATDFYTRSGSFDSDAEGYLRNSAGFFLFGWAIDDTGTVDSSTLVPVDIDILATTARPTSAAEMVLNLDAEQVPYDPHALSPSQELPVKSTTDSHFGRSLTVYDGNGTARQLFFEMRKIVGPMAHFTSGTSSNLERDDVLVDVNGPTPSIVNGDSLVIGNGTVSLTVDFVNGTADTSLNEANTVQDVISVINNFTAGGSQVFTASLSDDGRLLVQANDPAVSLNISASSASVLGGGGLNFVTDPGDADYIYDPEASLTVNGAANPNQTDFPAISDTTTPNPHGWWEMVALTIDPADPTGTTQVEISKGLINFNGDGSLNATLDANNQAILNFSNIDFDTTDATDDIVMTFDMTGFTQFSGDYTVGSADQNGAPLGTLADTEITDEGIVLAVFSNGIKLESYQLPIATFVNANGLRRIDGTAFAETEDSGTVTLSDAGTNGAGVIQVAALENSNVDLSEEFSSLIVSQRAFSLNGQVISAVDEMTQTLSRLTG